MPDPKPPVHVDLMWQGDLRFSGRSGDVELVLDSASTVGSSPMQALAFALAGCMAMDVAAILTKGRHPPTALQVALTGDRSDSEPHRFTGIAIHFIVGGPVPANVIERAIDLSRERYCSVWHSMRQDIDLKVTFEVAENRR